MGPSHPTKSPGIGNITEWPKRQARGTLYLCSNPTFNFFFCLDSVFPKLFRRISRDRILSDSMSLVRFSAGGDVIFTIGPSLLIQQILGQILSDFIGTYKTLYEADNIRWYPDWKTTVRIVFRELPKRRSNKTAVNHSFLRNRS